MERLEQGIYTVLIADNIDSHYDRIFGNVYDWIACGRLYNRLMWGYSISEFSDVALAALNMTKEGLLLDLGCGSLAFTANTYARQQNLPPLVLLDSSLKLLKMAKKRMKNLNGVLPDNMLFLQGDARQLPFRSRCFQTIISLNLIHVIQDVSLLFSEVKRILRQNGQLLATTLVRNQRGTDRYLTMWEEKGELFSRDISELCNAFNQKKMPIEYRLSGNMAFIFSK